MEIDLPEYFNKAINWVELSCQKGIQHTTNKKSPCDAFSDKLMAKEKKKRYVNLKEGV